MWDNLMYDGRVEAGRIVYLPFKQPTGTVGLGLAGTGVRAQSQTSTAREDLRVLGAITDVTSSLVSLRDASERFNFQNQDVLIKQFAGRRTLEENYKQWRPPFILRDGNSMFADALGAGAETGGNLILACDPLADAQRKRFTLPAEAYPFVMTIPIGLTSTASERIPVNTPQSKTSHMLVWGMGTDMLVTSVQITDVDNQLWMYDFTPIWAVAGYDNSGQRLWQEWPRPYLVPAGGRLRFEVQNPASGAISNGFLYLYCSRWPR